MNRIENFSVAIDSYTQQAHKTYVFSVALACMRAEV